MTRLLPLLVLTACLTDAEWQRRVDADGDGSPVWDDCDDGDPRRSNADVDGDGLTSCGDDCDDEDAEVGAGDEYWPDEDGDDHGALGSEPIQACDEPDGYTDDDPDDCDDDDPDVNPEADEVCADDVDNDCDGLTDLDDPDVVPNTWYPDGDDDGFAREGGEVVLACDDPSSTALSYVTRSDVFDCDDTDRAINPEADEVCDGVDNDCDDRTDDADDDVTDAEVWYPDADGDGFGADDPAVLCDDPTTTDLVWLQRDDAFDCDDDDPAIHPDADERCDGTDNDCDGATDDADDDVVDAPTWYEDADDDAWGDDDVTLVQCADPSTTDAPWASVGDDCAPEDTAINPDAEDLCDDRVDNDCDGLVDPCLDILGAGIIGSGGAVEGLYGAALLVTDVTGDGTDDLLVGEPGLGFVLGYDLGGLELPVDWGPGEMDLRMGAPPEEAFGAGLADLGDLDGDGRSELAIGAPGYNMGNGAVLIVHGADFGEDTVADDVATDFLLGTMESELGEELERGQILGADVDDDDIVDLVLGMPGDQGPPDVALAELGKVAVLSSELFVGVDAPVPMIETYNVLLATNAYDRAGAAVDAADIDGDGVADVIASVPGSDLVATDAGFVAVIEGPLSGDMIDVDLAIEGTEEGSEVGLELKVVSDIDGDGLDDLAVAAPGAAGGAGVVYLLTPGAIVEPRVPIEDAPWAFEGNPGEGVRGQIAEVGELNPAEGAELAFGSPGAASGAGAVYIVSPGALGRGVHELGSESDQIAVGATVGTELGEVLESVDVSGDGRRDLLIGVPHDDLNATDAGRLHILVFGPPG